MTSEVEVPRLAKSLAVRSFRSAGTRTWIRLVVVFVVAILISILYYIVIQKSRGIDGSG